MSILGITLDLNVYGFVSAYDEGFTPNKVDDDGRYSFGQQPRMMRWNLQRLADALSGRRGGKPLSEAAAAAAGDWLEPAEADTIGAPRHLGREDEQLLVPSLHCPQTCGPESSSPSAVD